MASDSDSTQETPRVYLPSIPLFQVYKDGRIERLRHIETVPPSDDPQTGVRSKDTPVARIFLPKVTNPKAKIPLLIYFHGGAFCIESPFSPVFHSYLTSLVNKANVIAVSVNYRKAPEHLLPIAYDDSWDAIKWIASHTKGDGPDPWLNDHADFDRVFLCGDSAGANIAHNMIMKAAAAGAGVRVDDLITRLKFVGLLLVNPYFVNDTPDELIKFIFPSSKGSNDPRLNPSCDLKGLAAGLICDRVLVCVTEKDFLRDRGVSYHEAVKKSGWNGVLEMVDIPEEEHVFHLFKPDCEKAVDLMNQVSEFLNR